MVGGDARDKIIKSRRRVTDARNVIRQQKVGKVGDLRAVLPRKRGNIGKRGRGFKDLRLTLGTARGSKARVDNKSRPQLVYAGEKPTQTNYKGPVNTNVTVGRGGKMTISRRRGRSIERDTEKVQPTGIPAHMRRQPSPPAPRAARSPSPKYREVSYSPPTQPVARPKSYSSNHKNSPMGRNYDPNQKAYGDWNTSPVPHTHSYRTRSRSPMRRPDGIASSMQFERDVRGYHTDSRGRMPDPLMDPYRIYQHRSSSPDERDMVFSSAFTRDKRIMRDDFLHRSPSPDRMPVRDHRQTLAYGDSYALPEPPYQPVLRMDQPAMKKSSSRNEKSAYADYNLSTDASRRGRVAQVVPQQRAGNLQSTQIYYCIRVTSLSHEVSEDDVVELFSDIGPLVSAKLVSKGHAEVCFVHKKDAKTAIDKYDRRELDGIPMNLKLVEKSSAGSRRSKASKLLLRSRQWDKPSNKRKKV
ncbi:serine/arginine repetitive matrix protein 1-like isoform X2 [Watersipora subatra]|uniref:serine/arginine repetitive matrix protein 1-like isoform X2 n=1 Tax=Watersipora subatra TaxID=2589382 RepID=UPI00355BE870